MVNSNYKVCLIFSFLVIVPFLIEEVEAIDIVFTGTGILNNTSTNSTLNDLTNHNFTLPIGQPAGQDSLLLVGLAMRDRNAADGKKIFLDDMDDCDNDNDLELRFLPGSIGNDTFRVDYPFDNQPSFVTEIHYLQLDDLVAEQNYYLCLVKDGILGKVSKFLLASAVIFDGVYFETNNIAATFPQIKTKDTQPGEKILGFNCVDEGNALFATITKAGNRKINNESSDLILEDGSIIRSERFSGGKVSSGVVIDGGSFTFEWLSLTVDTNTTYSIGKNQRFAISGVEIAGQAPVPGCIVDPNESLGISDKILVTSNRTLHLTETIDISDSLDHFKYKTNSCLQFWYLSQLDDINPTCTILFGYGGQGNGVMVSDNNGPKELVIQNCVSDDFIIALISLAPFSGRGSECFFDDGENLIVWTANFNSIYSPLITKTLTETLSLVDILDYLSPDPPNGTGPPPIVEPEPVEAVIVQKSTGSSSGGGRTGVNVSPKISDTTTTTSMDRIANWLSTPEHFKVALHNLIQQDIVDLEVSQIKDPPEWFYTTVEFWSTEQIDDQEFFNALEFILKN